MVVIIGLLKENEELVGNNRHTIRLYGIYKKKETACNSNLSKWSS
jgi:hypothetical protein